MLGAVWAIGSAGCFHLDTIRRLKKTHKTFLHLELTDSEGKPILVTHYSFIAVNMLVKKPEESYSEQKINSQFETKLKS